MENSGGYLPKHFSQQSV